MVSIEGIEGMLDQQAREERDGALLRARQIIGDEADVYDLIRIAEYILKGECEDVPVHVSPCICGHDKVQHLYERGACFPGTQCLCLLFTPVEAPEPVQHFHEGPQPDWLNEPYNPDLTVHTSRSHVIAVAERFDLPFYEDPHSDYVFAHRILGEGISLLYTSRLRSMYTNS